MMGMIAQRGLIPTHMWCRQEGESLFLEVEVETDDRRDLERLLEKSRVSVLVEPALLVGSLHR